MIPESNAGDWEKNSLETDAPINIQQDEPGLDIPTEKN
jgi:hypothetical protein